MNNLTSFEKAELMKSTITQLYTNEGRSISYISRLLEINRKTISQKIQEWNLKEAPHRRYLSPSNQKFLNKHRNLIKSRLDHDISLQSIAKEIHTTKDKLYRTFLPQDEVLQKAYQDMLNRQKEKTNKNRQTYMDKSSFEYNIQDLPNEVWKEIIGYPTYYVSNQGRIKHYAKRYKAYHLITPSPNKNNGRLYVKLINEKGLPKNLMLARIVGHSFVPGFDETHNTINHEDGDVTNNKASNLTWQTQSKNNKHAYEKLHKPKGNFRKYKFDYILYQDKYQFKTVAAFARFVNKSETQTRRYLDNPSKYNIKLVTLNK